MRSATEYWLIIGGMGLITLAMRLSMIVLLNRARLAPGGTRGLRFVPPAVFSALIAPALFRPQGALDLSPANPFLLAGIFAALLAWRGRNMFLTIAGGMAALWFLR